MRAGGRLLYVAGPSGAGKDAILGWAKRNLPEDAPVAFARRAITRARDGVSEDHEALSVAEFEARLARGEFAMAWTANGHRYGIGAEIREWLARGLTVVVSGSREYLPHARREFPDLEVVLVTASPEVLRERLAGRGRESADMIALRLERTDRFPPAGRVAAEVHNDGALDAAGQRFLKLLSKEMSGT
ncbi:MAG: phosphonate metabolism protein/1,5-bisphosphokinase (PRPP-forming) PhnN [Betaproteobacteria bacterium]|nr:phosphonate metabolism protein/1,5-bisphosphokinase (PRPP-forming) PhnN [Betaproteobacteria bacterium]